jgi:hypothetical protein
MVTRFDIPEPERGILKRWLGGDEEPTEAILDALEKADAALTARKLAEQVAEATPSRNRMNRSTK